MSVKRVGLGILAVLIMAVSYFIGADNNYDSKTVRIEPDGHALVVTSNDAVISTRILGMRQEGDRVYFVGYDGYGIYDGTEDTIILYPVAFRGNHREPQKTERYHKGVRNVKILSSYNDFSSSDREAFEELLTGGDRGSQFYAPFYNSGYESSLIDMDGHFFITNTVRALKRVDDILYVYDASGFFIINLKEKTLQAYFNNRIGGEGANGIPDSLKGYYGDAFTRIYALYKINGDDLTVLWLLRKQYLEKNHINAAEAGLFPSDLEDMNI